MQKLDNRMGLLYEMKNDYESKFYWCKNKLQELQDSASKQELADIQTHLHKAELWVEEEHQLHSEGSEQNLQVFQQKI